MSFFTINNILEKDILAGADNQLLYREQDPESEASKVCGKQVPTYDEIMDSLNGTIDSLLH